MRSLAIVRRDVLAEIGSSGARADALRAALGHEGPAVLDDRFFPLGVLNAVVA